MIEFDGVTKRFGAGAPAVDEVSLEIGDGEFFVLLGRSGSGKSTLLRLVNRLLAPSSGTVRVGGEDIATVDPALLRRRIGYVVQSIGLFPHWTVERNIATVPYLLGWARPRIRERVTELLTLLQLDPATFRAKYPHQLSGGQEQRVGVARALAADPEILLMDEPFGALDPITRAALQREMARLQQTTRKTIVFVTHDIDEAVTLGSRIALMESGRVAQVGTPLELLSAPADGFVREFVGGDEAGVKLLGIDTVASRMHGGDGVAPDPAIPASATLREALSMMILRRAERLAVRDTAGRAAGVITLADLVRR